MNRSDLVNLEVPELLKRLRDQVDAAIRIVDDGNLYRIDPAVCDKNCPLLEVGDFKIFPRFEK